jgi:hypothetical protein
LKEQLFCRRKTTTLSHKASITHAQINRSTGDYNSVVKLLAILPFNDARKAMGVDDTKGLRAYTYLFATN